MSTTPPEGTPARLVPLLEQYDWAIERLLGRLRGPVVDSGDGEPVEVPRLTDAEYRWEPVPAAWSVRRRAEGPATGATVLAGTGDWGRDSGRQVDSPWPPPVTTIAWRLAHLTEMLRRRADWTNGTRTLTAEQIEYRGDADSAVSDLEAAAEAWREALTDADDAALDRIGHSAYPDGSDPEDPFLHVVWWVNQEILHHGAEVALLRDLWPRLAGS